MKSIRAVWATFIFVVLAGYTSNAQFYAPETEYHDKVQRLFVVELARVLAWRENLKEPRFQEITYTVSTDDKRTVNWDIQLLGTGGKSLQNIKISYPEDLLMKGPEFYREVFGQMQKQGKWLPIPKSAEINIPDQFWKGAEQAGLSREEGLEALFHHINPKLSGAEQDLAPTVAGLMTHIALPSLSGGVTIDAALLARGAAWLCLGEAMSAKPPKELNQLWCPVIMMAGRERAAIRIWKESADSSRNKSASEMQKWWNFFFNEPTAREAFLYATDHRDRSFAMPMMIYYAELDDLGGTMAEVLYPLYADDKKTVLRLHNYGPYLTGQTGVAGGHLVDGMFAPLWRSAWLDTLKKFKPSSLDAPDIHEKVENTSVVLKPAGEKDKSLIGLKSVAPLLQLGYENGAGNLIPVGTVTTRDLLNYGWEINGLQMGARYKIVLRSWGIPDLAEAIFKESIADVQGQAAFFKNNFQKTAFNLQETLFRLQMVDGMGFSLGVTLHPYWTKHGDPEAAITFYKRCWLRPEEIRWQSLMLGSANLRSNTVQLISQYHQFSGKKADVVALTYTVECWPGKSLEGNPPLLEMQRKLSETIQHTTPLKIKTYYDVELIDKPALVRAQEYEKLFWQNPDSGLEERIISMYLSAGAFKSAERFYRQIREILPLGVGFSNKAAPHLWTLGFLQDNEELMEMALKDGNTGSFSSIMTRVYAAAAAEDWKRVESHLDSLISRYESRKGPDSTARFLKGFMPHLPALKGPDGHERNAALDYFGKSDKGMVLRWILIQKFKLNKEDSIRFLGGLETDYLRRVMLLYINGNADEIGNAYKEFIQRWPTDASWVIASWMTSKLGKLPVSAEEKDLRIADAKPIRMAVLERLAASKK